jgi:hypothetical protein
MCDLMLQSDGYKSVARIRLVKTEYPSACVTFYYKVYGKSGSAVLPVVPSYVNNVSINPIRTRFISNAHVQYFSTLEMEAGDLSETSVPVQQITKRHIPKDVNLDN